MLAGGTQRRERNLPPILDDNWKSQLFSDASKAFHILVHLGAGMSKSHDLVGLCLRTFILDLASQSFSL